MAYTTIRSSFCALVNMFAARLPEVQVYIEDKLTEFVIVMEGYSSVNELRRNNDELFLTCKEEVEKEFLSWLEKRNQARYHEKLLALFYSDMGPYNFEKLMGIFNLDIKEYLFRKEKVNKFKRLSRTKRSHGTGYNDNYETVVKLLDEVIINGILSGEMEVFMGDTMNLALDLTWELAYKKVYTDSYLNELNEILMLNF